MNTVVSKIRAFAELGRISNLPTTFTNVMVGVAIGAYGAVEPIDSGVVWTSIAIAWPAVACFYIAGMAMNDLVDVRLDAQERPQRPIPSGRVSRRAAAIFIIALFAIGVIVLSQINQTAVRTGLTLIVLIVLYNFLHARTAVSVLLLGLARGMVYAVGAAAIMPAMDWPHIEIVGGAMALYVAGFSLIARREMQPQARQLRIVAILLPCIVLAPLPFLWPAMLLFVALTLAVLAHTVCLYVTSPEKTKNAVMLWIASICLIDAMYLAWLWQAPLGFIAVLCFIITLIAQRRLSGT